MLHMYIKIVEQKLLYFWGVYLRSCCQEQCVKCIASLYLFVISQSSNFLPITEGPSYHTGVYQKQNWLGTPKNILPY